MKLSEAEPRVEPANSRGMVSLIIPTRNEAPNIEPLLERIAAAVPEVTIEVLFVDDSDDNTPQMIAQVAPQFPFLVRAVVRPPARRNGLSGAVVEGFRAARGEWLCVMDADLQHPPELIPQLLARAQEARADMVVGSRKADWSGPLGLSRRRAMISQLLTLLARAWFPRLLKNVSDPLTGLFLVRRAAVDVAALRPDGFKILLEILIRCPGLRVSEIHFDFAGRYEGESKADFQEGMRFFRHLLRLRLTANQSFPRLVLVALASVGLDAVAFTLLIQHTSLPWWLAAALLAQIIIGLRFAVTERWVLGRGHRLPGWPSWPRFWFSNQLSLFLVRLPLLYLFLSRWSWPVLLAVLLAISLEGIGRYIFSEQWVFSRRGMTMAPPGRYRYDIHGLLRLESQVPLPELAYFATAAALPHIDIQIRVDRHGTPTSQPGAISYAEQLSRFGFGVAIMPGSTYTEVVLSPLVAQAPYALYKSVLEPLLRWALAQRGYALVYGAAMARQGVATLLVPQTDVGKSELVLAAAAGGEYQFMGDDFVILAVDGRLFSFPKPITMTPALLRHTAVRLRPRDQFRLWLQNLVYTPGRRARGLQWSQQWPIATLNIIWQRLYAPPKRDVRELLPTIIFADEARLGKIIPLREGVVATDLIALLTLPGLNKGDAAAFLIQRQQALQGFPPYNLLLTELNLINEQLVIAQACGNYELGIIRDEG